MKSAIFKGGITHYLAPVLLSLVLVGCGGGSGDGSDAADGGLDSGTDGLDGGTDGLDGGTDADGLDGGTDSSDGGTDGDAGGDGPCLGTVGSDPDSSDADWANNCTISTGGPHRQSEYTRGIQRIVYCGGHFDTTDSLTDVDDADFGPNTAAAVTTFQSNNGLSPDGIVGPETWAMLRNEIEFLNLVTDNNDHFGMVGTPSAECDSVVLFYQAFDPDTFVPLSWRQAAEPGSVESRLFGIGFE